MMTPMKFVLSFQLLQNLQTAAFAAESSLRGSSCQLPKDCGGSECASKCCSRNRTEDPICPNCHGANWHCLTSQMQSGLGQAPAHAATYNDFGVAGNSGFCRYQAPIPGQNKSSAYESKLLKSGRVFAGVGLSQAQFKAMPGSHHMDGAIACGMCLEVTAKMSLWDCDLTQPLHRNDSSRWPEHKVIVMVIDQCKDQWDHYDGQSPSGNCATGHLDFDVYPQSPFGDLNVRDITWKAVDCPTEDLPIQFVFASTKTSKWHFALHAWDMRSPIQSMEAEVTCGNGTLAWAPMLFQANGWTYQATKLCQDFVADWPGNLTLRLTSVYDEVIIEHVKVPVDTWRQIDDWHAWPPAIGSTNFQTSKAPPSAEANSLYAHCKRNP
eukprot:TRINITY_DN50700_c0_g1_i1.p1 TRINITY_DN50700_c0_g1~~TRINITY_DN50700_c0_g1_i1.p1  ORF type:complete len:380 (+),score=59.33 TRINITY_DN50700_c0_g1_i1:107-1246(+)